LATAMAAAMAVLAVRCLVFIGPHRGTLRRLAVVPRAASIAEKDDPYYLQNPAEDTTVNNQQNPRMPQREVVTRDVKVTDPRDLAEMLRLPNPCRPVPEMQLICITKDDGTRIEYPKTSDLRRLTPSKLRPVIFTWRDRSQVQTRAPKEYDEIIQRLLNAGPADMEDLVRANWKQFDKAYFFRLTELKEDTNDQRLKDKIINLEQMSMKLIEAAQEQTRKSMPTNAKDAQEILNSMLEGDTDTLLWPPPAEAYKRLADKVELLAIRAQYDDAWFENTIEVTERFGKKMEVQQRGELQDMAKIVMQRIVTEWLRHDSLWEETDEGRFIFRLMTLSHEQWRQQLVVEQAPLDTIKLRDELKIISEMKIMALPMGSKLQVYAAKYIHGVDEFVKGKDELLKKMGKPTGPMSERPPADIMAS